MELLYPVGNCVYFIGEDPYTDKIKIGKSKDVNERLISLGAGNPNKLKIYYQWLVGDMTRAEKYLHDLYKDVNIHREWFHMSLEILEQAYKNIKNIFPICDEIVVGEEIKNSEPLNLNNIRMFVSETDGVLYLMIDVAKIIGNLNYFRYKSSELKIIRMKDKNGRLQCYRMLTERGLYEYLLKSKRPAAVAFCEKLMTKNSLHAADNGHNK